MGRRKRKKSVPAEPPVEPVVRDDDVKEEPKQSEKQPEDQETPEISDAETPSAPESEPETEAEPAAEPEDKKEEDQPEETPADEISAGAPPERVVRCPVCDGSGSPHAEHGEVKVCKCETCGLQFRSPRPSAAHIAGLRESFYEGALLKAHGVEAKEQNQIAASIMKGYHHRSSGRPAVLNAFGKRVLDVNCGLGLRLREFQKYGWEIYGVDTSPSAAEYARACALDVKVGWLDTVALKPAAFDLLVFQDTFNELPEPAGTVVKVEELLKSSGFVYVHLDRREDMEFRETGFFCFDPDSLRQVFMTRGFTMVLENKDDTGYFFWFKKKERRVVNDASEES